MLVTLSKKICGKNGLPRPSALALPERFKMAPQALQQRIIQLLMSDRFLEAKEIYNDWKIHNTQMIG